MKQKVPKREGNSRPRFTLACGILTAITFVSLMQAFFVFFKSHLAVDQISSIFTHRHYPISPTRLSPQTKPSITDQSHFPNNSVDSTRHSSRFTSLPTFSTDGKDVILSSLIERSSDSWSLHVTTFFLSTAMVDPAEPRQYKIDTIPYHANGARKKLNQYVCRMSFRSGAFTSNGYFLPNRQTLDSNSNRRVDILRCSIPSSPVLYKKIVESKDSVHVEITRNGLSIAHFNISLETRREGYLMTGPLGSTQLDAWKGFDPVRHADITHPPTDGDDLHICAARPKNMYGMPEKIFQYMEFLEHNLLLGAGHVYLSVDYSWESRSMRHILKALNRYIDSGKLTIMSEASDGINKVSSIEGMAWDYVSVRNIQINSCLYLSKGAATYLGVWDVNEFFIPKPPHNTIMDVIRAVSSPSFQPLHPSHISTNETVTSWKGGRGWADGEGHPFCYLAIGVRLTKRPNNALHPSHNIGIDSPVSPLELTVKSILPTKTIFQGGLHSAGVCKLEQEWSGCSPDIAKNSDDLCFRKIDDEFYSQYQFIANRNPTAIPANHAIDDVVFDRDRKKINTQTEAYLIEFASSNDQQPLIKSDIAVLGETENEYFKRFSSKVINGLSIRVPDMMTIGPIPNDESPPSYDSSEWIPFSTAFPKPPPSVAIVKQASAMEPALMDTDIQYIFNTDNIFEGSSNGPHHFTEDFARPDILDNPSAGVLPAFAKDFSDVGLGSIIERQHDSWNLFVTTFFLQHWMLWSPPDNYGMSKLYAKNQEKWAKASRIFNRTEYEESGARSTREDKYTCRLKTTSDSQAYSVVGVFMPNALTPDRNANRRVDIMRCQVLDSMRLYRHMTTSNESLYVEILKNDEVMFEFSIPWKTRRTGYALSSPAIADSFNAWKGFDPSALTDVLPGSVGGDKLYMCVPGVESPLSQLTITRYAEFFQHHLMLGVEHFFVGGTYAWNGNNMARLLALLHSYIDEGVMTVSSLAGDNVDLLYSILGLSTDRDNAKVMHVNMCLYLAKGVADYVAVWDTDEYFIPKLPHHSIIDVIRSAESPKPLKPFPPDTDPFALSSNWKGGRGWADGHAHPFCYLHLTSDCIFRKDADQRNVNKVSWIGEDFAHMAEPNRRGLSFQKSILPTRIIFQAGLHVGAACHLGHEWGGCDKGSTFCNANSKVEYHGYSVGLKNGQKTAVDFSSTHKFDGIVFNKDSKKIDPMTEALIYHIQVYRVDVIANDAVINDPAKNEYATRFWPAVKDELKRRGLYVLATLPEHIYARDLIPGDANWPLLWPATQEFVLSADATAVDRLEPSPLSFYGKPGELPHFVSDHSDVVLGAIVERQAESYNLYLATFFMAHEQLANFTGKITNRAVRPDSLNAWMKAIRHSKGVNYTTVGERSDGHEYTCVLSNRNGSAFYTVKGRFVPNEMTPDVNANKRLDILRCPIRDAQEVYHTLSHSDEHLIAKIFRDNYEVTQFTVPWKSRRTGYMLSAPSDMSRLDSWKGSVPRKRNTERVPTDFSSDDLHMCVPGMESPVSKRTVALYAEFMQHHYNVGVQHMYVAATYSWGGLNMDRFLGAFRSYIDDGLLTVTSSAGDEDLLYGLFGMSMDRDNVKIFFVNMCLYLSKGVADYLAIWDTDEYFIPKPPNFSIMDVIRKADSQMPLTPLPSDVDPWTMVNTWKGGKGWADGEGHPLCYFMLSSEVLYRPEDSAPTSTLSNRWVGSRFTRQIETQRSNLKFKKAILPTRKIFQGALHMAGGCRLDYPFTGCEKDHTDFCYLTEQKHRYGWSINTSGGNFRRADWSTEQRFDGLIMDKDAKKINKEEDAVIYHFQVHRSFHTSRSPATSTNDYRTHWFSNNVNSLRRRGIELLVMLPFKLYDTGQQPDWKWIPFKKFYANVDRS